MNIQPNQIQEIKDLLAEYNSFTLKLGKIQEKIENLDKQREFLISELEYLHSRENSLYSQLAIDNNTSIDDVKSKLVNLILT